MKIAEAMEDVGQSGTAGLVRFDEGKIVDAVRTRAGSSRVGATSAGLWFAFFGYRSTRASLGPSCCRCTWS